MTSSIERLTEIFLRFPGVGPRQAKRFVYHLLKEGPATLEAIASQIRELKQSVNQCPLCFRFYPKNDPGRQSKNCDLCLATDRDPGLLMIVEKDIDLENIERSNNYHGRYFVLGGLVPILDQNPGITLRLRELTNRIEVENKTGLTEVILAMAVNPEGDHTVDYLRNYLTPLVSSTTKISVLGRGLSTGSELEYSDPDTIKNAIKNRG